MRIGQGWDLHRLEDGLTLVLGGVVIPSDKGAVAHSDGDVLLHAIIDALLGAAALGDIGKIFPDTDAKYKDIDSSILLKKVLDLVFKKYYLINLDSTIVLQTPKLSGNIDKIRKNISKLLALDIEKISVKAKTKEKVDAVGRGEAIEASVIVLLQER